MKGSRTMVNAFFVTLLMHLPFVLIFGGLSYFIVHWCLRRQTFCNIIRIALLLSLLLLVVGLIYGVLRFNGLIIFPEDNYNSYNWFDSSYRDNGFKYIYCCGSVIVGIVVAYILSKRRT
jgi:hypothetical protein